MDEAWRGHVLAAQVGRPTGRGAFAALLALEAAAASLLALTRSCDK